MFGDNLGPIISDYSIRNVFSGNDNHLKIAHFNAHSLCPSNRSHKIDEMTSMFANAGLHIICVTETWLNPTIFNSAVSIPGYEICRSDRPFGVRGGGVAIYVADGIKFKVIYKSEGFGICEGLFIEMDLGDNIVCFGCVYLPRGNLFLFERNFSDIFVRFRNLIIVGDFNVNLFDAPKSTEVRSLCERFGLRCWHNTLPTHYDFFHQSSSLIDYFLVSCDVSIESSAQFQIPIISDHSLICASFAFPVLISNGSDYTFYRDYRKADLLAIERHVSLTDFSELYFTCDPNAQLSFLLKLFNELTCYIPLRKVKRIICWRRPKFTNHINYYRSLTNIALRAFYSNRSAINWGIYRNLRNFTKSLIRRFRREYSSRLFNAADSRQMWNCLRSAGVADSQSVTCNMDVDEINDQFINCQLPASAPEPCFSQFSCLGFSFSNIDQFILANALLKTKSCSVGADGISIKLIRIVYPFIHEHLLHFFNTILTSSTYPDNWKISRIVPIPKCGGSLTVNNIRPISILPALSKVLETILKEQMTEWINRNGLLDECQFGFRRGHSTVNMLTGLTDSIRDNFNRVCVLVSVDLSKAFDQVDHSLLVQKLYSFFGFSKPACLLIWSYLSERFQYVSFGGNCSSLKGVRSGVPQGSVIGPILFTMFLNDLFCNLVFGSAFVFADDIQLVWSGLNQFSDALQATINYDLAILSDWTNINGLSINTDKTKAIFFRTNSSVDLDLNLRILGRSIMVTNSIKCLGMILDENLSFTSHIDNICLRVCSTLRRLYHLNLYLPLYVRKSVAHALLMSQVNYGIEVYSGCNLGNRRKVRSIVHKVVRFVYGLRFREHVSDYLKSFLNMSFDSYLKFRLLIYLYNIVRTQRPIKIAQLLTFCRSTRNPQILIPRVHNTQFQRSFVVRAARLWNFLPIGLRIFSFSVPVFKRRIIDFLNGILYSLFS